MVRAIRGATTVNANEKQEILDATVELLKEMAKCNEVGEDDIISIIFSVTVGLNAVFPAVAARQLGWTRTAMMSTLEIDVPGSLRNCIRVMMHIHTEKVNNDLKYIYLKGAKVLRPDLLDQSQSTEESILDEN